MTELEKKYNFELHRRGFTLIELAIVLLVASIVVASIWAAASGVWTNYEFYRVNQQVMTVVQNVRNYYQGAAQIKDAAGAVYPNGTAISSYLDGLGLIPLEMRRNPTVAPGSGTDYLDHALNNRFALGTGSFFVYAEANGTEFRVELQGLNPGTCITLLTKQPLTPDLGIVGAGTQTGYTTINVNGTAADGTTLPINSVAAAEACSDVDATNIVYWDFTLHDQN